MVLTKEMQETINFLSKKKNYAIFAGFAAELHTGIKSSQDIDIFLPGKKEVVEFTDIFLKDGWKKIEEKSKEDFMKVSLEKNGTTIDLITSRISREISLPNKEEIKFKGKSLFTISKEELFLGKMVGCSYEGRLKSKQIRDKKVVNILKKKLDQKKLRFMLDSLPTQFFTGWIL